MAINNTFKPENLNENGLKSLDNALNKFTIVSFGAEIEHMGIFSWLLKCIQCFIKYLQNYFTTRISSQTLFNEIHLYKKKLFLCPDPTWNLDLDSIQRVSDRKLVHISNIDRLAIAHPPEPTHVTKSKFDPDSGKDQLDMIHECDQFYISETNALIAVLEFLESRSRQLHSQIDARQAASHVLCKTYQKLNRKMKEASNHYQQVFYFMLNHVIVDLIESSENGEDSVFFKNLSETRQFLETKMNWDIKVRFQLQKKLNDFSTKG